MSKESALKVILKQFSQTNDMNQAIEDIIFIFDKKAVQKTLEEIRNEIIQSRKK